MRALIDMGKAMGQIYKVINYQLVLSRGRRHLAHLASRCEPRGSYIFVGSSSSLPLSVGV